MKSIKVFYLDDSSGAPDRILMTIDGDYTIIPHKEDVVQINEQRFIVTDIVHEFLQHSSTQVISVHTINGFEHSMRK